MVLGSKGFPRQKCHFSFVKNCALKSSSCIVNLGWKVYQCAADLGLVHLDLVYNLKHTGWPAKQFNTLTVQVRNHWPWSGWFKLTKHSQLTYGRHRLKLSTKYVTFPRQRVTTSTVTSTTDVWPVNTVIALMTRPSFGVVFISHKHIVYTQHTAHASPSTMTNLN